MILISMHRKTSNQGAVLDFDDCGGNCLSHCYSGDRLQQGVDTKGLSEHTKSVLASTKNAKYASINNLAFRFLLVFWFFFKLVCGFFFHASNHCFCIAWQIAL